MKEDYKILDALKKQESTGSFKVPNDYFESFEDKMMATIVAEEKSTTQKIIMVMKPWAALAAIFIFIALVYYSAPFLMPKNETIALNSDLSIDFLSSNFNETELIDFIVESDNSAIFEQIETDQNLLEGISIEDVESLVIF